MITIDQHQIFTMPKTASAWLQRVAVQYGGLGEDDGDQHRAARHVDPSTKIKIGAVRDPWSWYASLYFHARDSDMWRALWRVAGRELDPTEPPPFRDVLYGFTHPESRIWPHDSADPNVHRRAPGIIWPVPIPFATAGWTVPLWSWSMLYTYGAAGESISFLFPERKIRWGVAYMYDCRRVAEAIEEMSGVHLTKGPEHRACDRAIAKKRDPVPDYLTLYDDEMLGWVQAADGRISDDLALVPFCARGGRVLFD